jgi:Sigma-70, region 4
VTRTSLGSVAIALLFAAPAAAQIGQVQLPKVQAPAPQVQVPNVQLPSVQVPKVQVPSVQVPKVQVPSVQVPSVPAPSTPSLPSNPLPSLTGGSGGGGGGSTSLGLGALGAGSGGGSQGGTVGGVVGALGSQAGAPGQPAGSSAAARAAGMRGAKARRRAGVAGTEFQTREDLVQRLRGCVDNLPPLQRAVIVLRYGIGPATPRSQGRTARTLGLSRGRTKHLERAGVRSLARDSRRSNCENTGVATSTLFDVARIVNGPDFLLAAAGLKGEGGADPVGDVIAVKGTHASGGDGEQPHAAGGFGPNIPFLSSPFGGAGGPAGLLIAALVAAIAVSLGVAARVFARAEH